MTDTLQKSVKIEKVDTEARTATGAVMIPNEVDRQRDFARPDAIRRMVEPNPDDGVLHVAFPDDAAELTRYEVVDEPTTIGETEFPAGTLIATRKYHDDALWQLVRDGILDGFSIGGAVFDEREYGSAAEVPRDVRFPPAIEEGPATEIVDGRISEVSDVDVPAVPRATFRELGKLGKSVIDDISGKSEFVDVFTERGHDPDDARRLWRYLDEQTDANVSPSGVPEPAETAETREQSPVNRAAGMILDALRTLTRAADGDGGQSDIDALAEQVDVLPPGLDSISTAWLNRWAEWIAAGRPEITETATEATKVEKDFNPALHPRDPDTGQFVERRFDLPDDAPNFGEMSTKETLAYIEENGGPVDPIFDPDANVTVDGVPNNATSVEEIPEEADEADPGRLLDVDALSGGDEVVIDTEQGVTMRGTVEGSTDDGWIDLDQGDDGINMVQVGDVAEVRADGEVSDEAVVDASTVDTDEFEEFDPHVIDDIEEGMTVEADVPSKPENPTGEVTDTGDGWIEIDGEEAVFEYQSEGVRVSPDDLDDLDPSINFDEYDDITELPDDASVSLYSPEEGLIDDAEVAYAGDFSVAVENENGYYTFNAEDVDGFGDPDEFDPTIDEQLTEQVSQGQVVRVDTATTGSIEGSVVAVGSSTVGVDLGPGDGVHTVDDLDVVDYDVVDSGDDEDEIDTGDIPPVVPDSATPVEPADVSTGDRVGLFTAEGAFDYEEDEYHEGEVVNTLDGGGLVLDEGGEDTNHFSPFEIDEAYDLGDTDDEQDLVFDTVVEPQDVDEGDRVEIDISEGVMEPGVEPGDTIRGEVTNQGGTNLDIETDDGQSYSLVGFEQEEIRLGTPEDDGDTSDTGETAETATDAAVFGPGEEIDDPASLDVGDTAYIDADWMDEPKQVEVTWSPDYTDGMEVDTELGGELTVSDEEYTFYEDSSSGFVGGYTIPSTETLDTNVDHDEAVAFNEELAERVDSGDPTDINATTYNTYAGSIQDPNLVEDAYEQVVENNGAKTTRKRLEQRLRGMPEASDPEDIRDVDFDEVPETRQNTVWSDFDRETAVEVAAHVEARNGDFNEWGAWNDFLDNLTDDEIRDALEKAVFEKDERNFNSFDDPHDYVDGVDHDEDSVNPGELNNGAAALLSRAPEGTADDLIEQLDERAIGQQREYSVYRMGASFLSDPEDRRRMYEEGNVDHKAANLQFDETMTPMDRMRAIGKIHTRTTSSKNSYAVRAMMAGIEDGPHVNYYNDKKPIAPIEPPDSVKNALGDHQDRIADQIEAANEGGSPMMNSNIADEVNPDGTITIYRGASSKYTGMSSVQSWSTDYTTASSGMFNGQGVMEYDADPEEIVAVQGLTHDQHPTEEEVTMLGGAIDPEDIRVAEGDPIDEDELLEKLFKVDPSTPRFGVLGPEGVHAAASDGTLDPGMFERYRITENGYIFDAETEDYVGIWNDDGGQADLTESAAAEVAG
ncbi:hypothetical protein Z052_02005 [Halorubrum sp. C191]|uniref:XkdF-like putative serine protease domain-containing protein n=1 Tax=Halorubrum sp. C191 TaxID=1383842 RepID=UPI000C07BF84|nr:XkdF-like putative serine protease domain-containing protein [Halorubrum sp. C191]PHQ43937.1 hypothetical protein Z052_02005 [Halorubrum sp. C191]